MKTPPEALDNIVVPGSYVLSRGKDKTLETHLGTGVGVALCDRRAVMGGLIHLLLPEPTGIDKPWQPESYATTGLPLVIRALCDLGAQRERLLACVDGGALLGSLSEKDSGLDIGVQTVEVVEEILHREGISIHRSETGGCLRRCLSLSLQTWETDIRLLDAYTAPAQTGFNKPTAEQLDQSIQRVRPIPQIALKAMHMIRDPAHSLEDVAKEIRQDQVLTGKVPSLCNSALFGLRTRVESIDRAVALAGERRILQLVISASVEEFFPQAEQGYSLCKGGLYQHALGTAIFAETLAQFTGRVSADAAYTAGLLHDIGKVVLDQYLAPVFPFFYRQTETEGVDLVAAEAKAFGVSHPEIGGRLAKHWSLPEALRDTIRHHHSPEKATVNPELTHLVYLTDLLMSRFLVGQELERLSTDNFALRLERIGLSLSHLPITIDLIPRGVFEASG